MAMEKLCLVMIVRDEEAVIERALRSALPFIDCYSICDTGSSDRTREIISGVLENLPGKVHDRPWVGFGHNRTESIMFARELFPDKFGLVLDADDTLEVAQTPGVTLPEKLSADYYDNPVRFGTVLYMQPHVIRLALPFRYEGVTHEFLTCDAPAQLETMHGLIYVINSDGRARADGSKLRRDIDLLSAEVSANPADARSHFYLAQSFRDEGNDRQALRHYKRRVELPGWDEETFIARLEMAKCIERLNPQDINLVMQAYLDAHEARPTRAEPLFELGRYLRQHQRHSLAYLYLKHAAEMQMPPDRLFLDSDVYAFRALDELAISAFYVPGKRQEAAFLNQLLLSRVPPHEKARIIGHLAMCREIGTESWAVNFQNPQTDESSPELIPRIIHQIWIGPRPPPRKWLETWQAMHLELGWQYRLWDNEAVAREAAKRPWECQKQIEQIPEWNGKADILRYEILKRYGGVCFDADSVCVQPLDDHFLKHQAFACYENEVIFPGRIATGYLGAEPGSAVMTAAVAAIANSDCGHERAWIEVGPVFFTNLVQESRLAVFVYPARTFIPEHWKTRPDGGRVKAPGTAAIYAEQFWGSTLGYPEEAAGHYGTGPVSDAENSPSSNAPPDTFEMDDQTPLVSVVIPCLGQAQFLPEAIGSVRRQTLDRWELIVIAGDVASHTAAQEAVRTDPRISVITTDGECVSNARNLGFGRARARLVLPLDADDMIAPTFLEQTVGLAPPDPYVIVSTNLQEFGERTGHWDLPDYCFSTLIKKNILGNSSLVSRALWQAAGGYDPALVAFEDWAFWIACGRLGPVVRHVPQRLLQYRIHPGSHTERTRTLANVFTAMVRVSHADLYHTSQIASDYETIASMPAQCAELVEARLRQLPENERIGLFARLAKVVG